MTGEQAVAASIKMPAGVDVVRFSVPSFGIVGLLDLSSSGGFSWFETFTGALMTPETFSIREPAQRSQGRIGTVCPRDFGRRAIPIIVSVAEGLGLADVADFHRSRSGVGDAPQRSPSR
jgi:hypothetical protein